jgi:enhanced entry protein LpnE
MDGKMKKIWYAMMLVTLSGCSVNIPVIGPTVEILEDSPCFQEALEECQETETGSLFVERSQIKESSQTSKFEFYRWAALQGYKKAYAIVANHYLSLGGKEDIKEALYWLEKGVEESDVSSAMRFAQYLAFEALSPNYRKADGVLEALRQEDYIPALLLSAKIAKQEDKIDLQILYLEKARQLGDLSAAKDLEQLVLESKNTEEYFSIENPYEELADLKGFWKDFSNVSQVSSYEVEEPAVQTQSQFKQLLQEAAKNDSSYASLLLAQDLFYRSFDSYESSEKLKQYLNKARDIPAAKTLYARAIFSQKISGSFEQAYSQIQQAAEQEDPYALFFLSLHERFVKKNYDQSLVHYFKAQKADSSSRGQYHVALDLLEGRYDFLADDIAYTWLASLASAHYPPALLRLADLKEEGKVLCQNEKEVFLHRAQAAYLGNPQAAYQVGNMYFTGKNVHFDHKKAFLWFMYAAKRGYAPAQYQLAQMYRQGYGVIADKVKSYAWMSLVPTVYEHQLEQLDDLLSQMSQEEIAKSLHMSQVLEKYYLQSPSFVNF